MLRRPGRPGSALVVLTMVGAGMAVTVGWGVLAGLAARGDLLEVREVVEQVRDEPPADAQALRQQLEPAVRAAANARRTLTRPGPALVARLPVLGRSLAVERDAAITADVLLETADTLLAGVDRLQVDGGGVDVTLLRGMAADLDRAGRELQGPLSRLRTAPLRFTPGSVRGAVEELRDELAGLDDSLRSTAAAADAFAGLLGADGQRTLAIVLMNNAELRGAGGYGGSFALMRTDGGRFSLGAFQDVNEVQDSAERARRVPAPDDYAARWGRYLADSTLWKNTLMSADQPASASVTCEVVRLAPGEPCDGVLLLDVPALARLVELSGPVDLGGGERISGDNLVEALLVEAYADTGDTAGDQAQRRQRLRTAADDAVSGLLDSRLVGVEALRTLADAVRGRHLAVWSARPEEQEALHAAGLSGAVDPEGDDLNLVAVNQFSAGKLDYYVTRSVGLLAIVDAQEVQVTQKVTLSLDTPPGLPPYVLGTRGGRLEELMDIAVSPAATQVIVRKDGREVPAVIAQESGSRRVEVPVELVDGGRVTWEISYRVPVQDGRYRLRLLPQPLAVDAVLHLAVVAEEGRRLTDGEVLYDGAYDRARTIEVQLAAQD